VSGYDLVECLPEADKPASDVRAPGAKDNDAIVSRQRLLLFDRHGAIL
jgi:hypothetical protein